MRLPGILTSLIASLCLVGCSSTSGIDALDVGKPSNEITSSVVRPSAPVASMPAKANANNTRKAPEASVAESVRPFGLAEEETVALSAPELPDSVDPPVEPAALVSPPKLLSRAAPAMLAGPVTRYAFRDAKPINFGRSSPGIWPCTVSTSRAGKAT